MSVLLLTVLIRAGERRKDRERVNLCTRRAKNDVPLGSPDFIFLSLAIFCWIELMNHCQTRLMFLIMCEGFSSFNELYRWLKKSVWHLTTLWITVDFFIGSKDGTCCFSRKCMRFPPKGEKLYAILFYFCVLLPESTIGAVTVVPWSNIPPPTPHWC